MAINRFDVTTMRRISLGLFAASGALFLTAVNLAGSATIADKTALTSELAKSTSWLAIAVFSSLISFIWTELASHDETPKSGKRHSKNNYLESAFALMGTLGLCSFAFGGYQLAKAVGLLQ